MQLRQRLLGWSGHVESWLDQNDIPVYVVRYEDLKADTVEVFRRALDFLGETPDSRRLERAVRNSRFTELQRQEKQGGFREHLSMTTPSFRRGETAGWHRELAPAQVERIEDANRAVMRRMGYLAMEPLAMKSG